MFELKPKAKLKESDRLEKVKRYVNKNSRNFIGRLRTAISLDTVWTDENGQSSENEMLSFLEDLAATCSATCKAIDIGFQESEGGKQALPKVLLIQSQGTDPEKPTVLVYGFYDVLQVDQRDGWTQDPFSLAEKGDKLVGRGTACMKGLFLPWLFLIEMYSELKWTLPVNVKIMLEGMGEGNSECIDELAEHESGKNGFLGDVDFVVVPQASCYEGDVPSLPLALRGLVTVDIEVFGHQGTGHSELSRGNATEPAKDLIQILWNLVGYEHKFMEELGSALSTSVPSKSKKQGRSSEKSRRGQNGSSGMEDHSVISVSVNAVEVYNSSSSTSIVPPTGSARLSFRVPAHCELAAIAEKIKVKVEQDFDKLKSPNALSLDLEIVESVKCNESSIAFKAAKQAVKEVFGQEARTVEDAATIKALPSLQDHLRADVVVVPMCSRSNNLGSEDENISRRTYLDGVTFAAMFVEHCGRLVAEAAAQEKENAPAKSGFLLDSLEGLFGRNHQAL